MNAPRRLTTATDWLANVIFVGIVCGIAAILVWATVSGAAIFVWGVLSGAALGWVR